LFGRDETTLRRLLAAASWVILITGRPEAERPRRSRNAVDLNEPTRKILTIEDPVEYENSGYQQSQAKPAIG